MAMKSPKMGCAVYSLGSSAGGSKGRLPLFGEDGILEIEDGNSIDPTYFCTCLSSPAAGFCSSSDFPPGVSGGRRSTALT